MLPAKAARASATIALVRPPVLQLRKSLSAYGAILPIGLAYVAAALREAGHRIQVIDAPGEAIDRVVDVPSPIGTLAQNGLGPAEIVERIAPGTQILGITHMFLHEWPTVRAIAEAAKAKIPGLVVVVGGENATSFWSWMFAATDAVDYCVLGEGEATMLELVHRLTAGLPVTGLQGIASRAEHGGAAASATTPGRKDGTGSSGSERPMAAVSAR